MHPLHRETHLVERIGWLRAAVLGANDGIISTASLMIGVATASSNGNEVLVAGLAGLAAGSMAMAAGEYVSVSSQADTEAADLAKERRELAEQPEAELEELTQIYVKRGLDPDLARKVAVQLTERDAFGAHVRDELGLSEHIVAQPVQAAITSAITFAIGAFVPVLLAFLAPKALAMAIIGGGAIVGLGVLGAVGAIVGGSSPVKPAIRVVFWGIAAMLASALMGQLVGHAL